MNIDKLLKERGITEILHFSTNRGVVGTLAKRYLLSRYRLPADLYLKHVLQVNSTFRPEEKAFFDKSHNWLDYVNLSITEINKRFFEVSQNWHKNNDLWWAIMSFDARIATHEGVIFTTTNNSYEEKCIREKGIEGFERMFSALVERKSGWTVGRSMRDSNLATCEQAEVLYPGEIDIAFLRKIYVVDGEHHDTVRSWLKEFDAPDIEVLISPEKFIGQKN